jgi:integrase
MSSLHEDKGRLVISFYIDRRSRVRLFLGIDATREGYRSPIVKEVRALIAAARWEELARRFPCKQLAEFRPALTEVDVTTFRRASDRFLVHQANSNEAATVAFYSTILKTHIWPVPAFAEKPIRLIGASDITAVFGPVRQRGHQAQAANIRRVISAVFNWARGERGTDGEYLVTDNPTTRTRPVKIVRGDDVIDPFTPEEIRSIVMAARDGWERRIVVVAIGAGLDPGENFGLKRANLNFATRKIQVRQRFTRYGEGALKNEDRRRRDVDMAEPVYQALREQAAATELRSVWLWPGGKLNPKPHNPQQFSSKGWPVILKRAGVKHREFYQCRHTFATLLLRGGTDWQYVADQMGHSDLTMLQKHYWKWRPGSTPKPIKDIIGASFSF